MGEHKLHVLGATGEFPNGKANPTDEGELRFGVTTDEAGNVCIHFGKPVAWFGMPPQQAVGLAQLLIEHAREAANLQGSVLVITI
jgi:hypothetical protein